jgi:RNA-directed DNA polymerase
LGIPTVKERIVQTAVKFVLEPIFEATFRSMSYGFRPGRGCRDALREVDQLVKEGYTFVVDADLESYFDTIPHERLMQRVEERISDGRVLGLLRSWLGQEIMRGMERWKPTEGTPQGAVISPLLSNIYLHPLDELMAACGYRMVRYADDFVVLCKSREEAEAALVRIGAWVKDNGLRLHPGKTHIGDCRNRGEGFEFLGYRFEAGLRHVRKKSFDRLKDNIRAKTKRTRGDSLARVIESLNPILLDGSTTSNMRAPALLPSSTSSFGDGCVHSCASRRSGPASAKRSMIISNGLMHSSLKLGCSR